MFYRLLETIVSLQALKPSPAGTCARHRAGSTKPGHAPQCSSTAITPRRGVASRRAHQATRRHPSPKKKSKKIIIEKVATYLLSGNITDCCIMPFDVQSPRQSAKRPTKSVGLFCFFMCGVLQRHMIASERTPLTSFAQQGLCLCPIGVALVIDLNDPLVSGFLVAHASQRTTGAVLRPVPAHR